MTYDQLEETQRRQITQAMIAERADDLTLSLAHIMFWKDMPNLGSGPCWQWPYHTLQVLRSL